MNIPCALCEMFAHIALKIWFYHELGGIGFKRPEDRSQKSEESANLKFIPTN